MGLSSHTAEDFVLDPEFRKWVLCPNSNSNIRWECYLDKNPGNRNAILLAKRIVLNLEQKRMESDGLSEADKANIWNKIKEGAAQKQVLNSTGGVVVPISSEAILNKQRTKKDGFWLIGRYAAVLLFSLGLGCTWLFFVQRQSVETEVVVNWQNYETPPGVKSTITLSDGSVVTLNSGTRIWYVENFIGLEREIFLEGEAFFVVARDTAKPFVVHAGGLSTRALGTSFNIKAFGDEMTVVSLVTGSIEVKDQKRSSTERILPGEGVFFHPNRGNLKRQKVNLDHITAWMHKTIIFDNTPFETAMGTLEKWYGIHIKLVQFTDRDLQVTGRYHDETLENILEGLGYGIGIDYQIKGKEVTILFEQ